MNKIQKVKVEVRCGNNRVIRGVAIGRWGAIVISIPRYPHPPMISPTLGWESRLLISKGARRDRRAQIALMWVIFICHKLGWAFFHQLNPVELLGWMQLDKLHKEHHLHGNLTGSKNKSTQKSRVKLIQLLKQSEPSDFSDRLLIAWN